MPNRSDSDRELAARIEASLEMDLLSDAYTDAEIDELIRAGGGDPAAIGKRGTELGAALATEKRLAWQEAAKKRKAFMEAAVSRPGKSPPFPVGDPIPAILAAAAEAGMRINLRGRKAEETSREELQKLWEKIHEALALRDALKRGDSDK